MIRLTITQCINLNQNNKSAVARQYPVLLENTEPILPLLVGISYGRLAGWLAGKQNTGGFHFSLNSLYKSNYSDFYFVYYQSNAIIISAGFFKLIFNMCIEVHQIC